MAIRQTLIDELSEKNVLLLASNQTLNEIANQLNSRGLSEASTYVVVALPEASFRVATATELARVATRLGPASFFQPLAELPITPATEVIRQDTPEAGGRIRERVTTSPNKTFVIVNDQGFVALFVNPTRSGMDLASSTLLRLHGEMAPIGAGAAPALSIQPPECPYCHYQGWYRFEQGHYTCQNCGQIVATP